MATATLQKTRLYTPEEYLTLERAAEFKSEYRNGEIWPMAGASRSHIRISVNLVGRLYPQVLGRPCEVYASEMRVRVGATGLYTYPDVIIVSGEPQFDDAHFDVLLNPAVIIEILSPSKEAYDRGAKREQYRRLPSLREYVLVAQDEPRSEQWTRQSEDGEWQFTVTKGMDSILRLDSIGCVLSLSEIYDRVRFDSGDAGDASA